MRCRLFATSTNHLFSLFWFDHEAKSQTLWMTTSANSISTQYKHNRNVKLHNGRAFAHCCYCYCLLDENLARTFTSLIVCTTINCNWDLVWLSWRTVPEELFENYTSTIYRGIYHPQHCAAILCNLVKFETRAWYSTRKQASPRATETSNSGATNLFKKWTASIGTFCVVTCCI